MSQKCIFVTEEYFHDFLQLPNTLYKHDINPRNVETEIQLLSGTHVLSGDIQFFPYIVMEESQVVARCALTYYAEDDTAYLGFFDAYDNLSAVQTMFSVVENKAKVDGKSRIIGPIDASIYINYRFKTDRFDKIYTSEPYNKEYYPRLWTQSGYKIKDKYMSNQLRQVQQKDIDERLARINMRFQERNYLFTELNKKTFISQLEDIYELMMDLYSDFTGYKRITKEQFVILFSSLQHILDFSMTKLAYKDNKMQAFCIAIPNYNGLTHGYVSMLDMLKIMRLKMKPKEYVILYAGSKSPGLGGALVHEIREELFKNQCTSIGALIKEGNVTGTMYQDLYTDKFSYVLLSKEI